MLKAAQTKLCVSVDSFDAQPNLFNCANGTLELLASDVLLRVFIRSDQLTQLSPVPFEPEASAPRWHEFLKRIQPDQAIRRFLQTWYGYCMTASTKEQKLLINYGTGANGKSVFVNTLLYVMGGYGATTPVQTFMYDKQRRGGEASPDLARLKNARIVMAAEPEIGARIGESLVKATTGGEKIAARHLYADMFEFTPRFKIVISTNVRPYVRGQDEGIWRRILLVPFAVTIPEEERQEDLPEKLLEEAPGILNWMLDGWRLYSECGLFVPDEIRAATAQYRSDSDPVYQFLEECTIRANGQRVQARDFYHAFQRWCRANIGEPISQKRFGSRLLELGRADKVRINGVYFYRDIALVTEALPQSSTDEGESATDSTPY